MYPEFTSKAILRIFQRSYCDTTDRYQTCERFKAASAGTPPAPRLLPTGEYLPAPVGQR